MTTMLEKMAEIIEAKVRAAGAIYDYDGTDIARATLLAIREVDQETFNAGWAAMTGEPDAGPGEPWLAMIDAILDEKTP